MCIPHLDYSTAKQISLLFHSPILLPQNGAEGLHGSGPSQLVSLSLHTPSTSVSRILLLLGPTTFHIFTFTLLPPFSSLGYLPCSLYLSSGTAFPGILELNTLEAHRTVSESAFLVPRFQRLLKHLL